MANLKHQAWKQNLIICNSKGIICYSKGLLYKLIKSLDRSMKVKCPTLVRNYDRQINQPTDRRADLVLGNLGVELGVGNGGRSSGWASQNCGIVPHRDVLWSYYEMFYFDGGLKDIRRTLFI